MQIIVQQKSLAKEVALLQGVTSGKKASVNPALTMIHLQAAEDLHLTGSNDDITIRTRCSINDCLEPGAILLPAKKFFEIIKEFDSGPISIETQEANRVLIRSGKTKITLAGQSVDHYPEPPQVGDYPVSIAVPTLLGQILRTEFGIPKEIDTRAPKCVQLRISDNKLTMNSIDGNVMPHVVSNILFADTISTLVPEATLEELQKILYNVESEDSDKETSPLVWIQATDNKVMFKTGDRELISKINATPYPDCDSYLGKLDSNNKSAVLNTSLFSRIVRRVMLMADKKGVVALNFKNRTLNVTSAGEEGDAEDPMEVESEGLGNFEIAFSGNILQPALASIKTEKFKIRIKDNLTPVVISPVNDEGFEYNCMIAPVRPI